MNVYIWHYIEQATSCYHPEGGVVVFADDENEARLIALAAGAKIQESEKPDHVRPCTLGPRTCFIFRDTGCC